MNEVPPPDANGANDTQTTSKSAPVETLAGDRLCMQCMHPLVGSPITREPQTGLLYVRCGECGTASALFEYPTFGPWIRRMKAVASSTLIAIALGMVLLIGGIAVGFTGGAADAASDAAGGTLLNSYQAHGGAVDETTWGGSTWGNADMNWIGTPEGAEAIADARWSLAALFVLFTVTAIGAMVISPFAAILGVVLMHRNALERAIVCTVLVGGAAAIVIAVEYAFNTTRGAPTWRALASEHHGPAYASAAAVALAASSAAVAGVAPAIAAAIARFILPPRDRRLVAWLWEWRGKQVPRT